MSVLTADQTAALNSLHDFIPAMGKPSGVDNPMLGDKIAALEAAAPDGMKAALQTAAAATAVAAVTGTAAVTAAADVTALGTVTWTALGVDTITAITAPDGSDATSTQNLANDLKLRQAENKTAIDDIKLRCAEGDVAVASLAATAGTAITLANDLKSKYNTAVAEIAELKLLVNDLRTKFNALANGIDAL